MSIRAMWCAGLDAATAVRADDECCYCQDGRLAKRRKRTWALAAGLVLDSAVLVVAGLWFHLWPLALMYLLGMLSGAQRWHNLGEIRRLSSPQRCLVTDDMIRNAAVRAFAKHLHEYDTTIQREKLPSIARAFINERRSEPSA